ncbi:ATP:cob(I)alamin adenosyltransferase [Dysgonamonadaceae bacterium]|jgi:cob(I)alamin adenosyltransferase|nr:ATP:cob(I)alamin adenosyltransferase [Dysgonamonadaceae bacterium]PLB85907.1 ATP:cob(I)alamin adenosyltransferase [Dysgonamonadaceae bacterium]
MKKSLIYTKTGDAGTTSLVGGTRVEKTHIRLDAYGTVDELNSFVGWLACEMEDDETKTFLSFVQNKLFAVGSYLATETESVAPKAASIISEDDISKIEIEIDRLDEKLPKLNRFILPGGSESASRAHVCRSICRRAERMIYKVADKYPVDERITRFVNRLSDYFFVLARKEVNENGKEVYWEK